MSLRDKLVVQLADNCDNLELLDVARYLLWYVANDVDYINKESEQIASDYMIDYDLGNDAFIRTNDLEELYDMIKKLNEIVNYNDKKGDFYGKDD